MPAFLVVQQREYRQHRIEIIDRGRAGCAVVVHPPSSQGEPWKVSREEPVPTLADQLNQVKTRIDAAMGPRPTVHLRHAARRDR